MTQAALAGEIGTSGGSVAGENRCSNDGGACGWKLRRRAWETTERRRFRGKKNRMNRRRRFGRKQVTGNPSVSTEMKSEHGSGLAHERKAKIPTSKSGNSPRRKIRPATPTNHLDQDQIQEHKKNFRFGTNTNKMQTRNFSMRSKQSLHPIHGGLRPPLSF
jgi:hypothetical protein